MVHVESMLEKYLNGNYTLSIIDVVDDPEGARGNMVFATPVLIKHHPNPERRVLGDFTNEEKIAENLEIDIDK